MKKDNLSLHKRNAAEDERNLSTYFSIKTLGDNVEWTYNAPIPPSSYWHELGFDAEYIEDLNEYIIERIKDVRLRIRRGQCQDEIDIDLGNCESSYTIIHNDTLSLHWKELADALVQHYPSYRTNVDFSICGVQLPSVVLDMLIQGLVHKKMHCLALRGVVFQVNREGIDFAVNKLQTNRELRKFEWSYCGTLGIADSTLLYNAVLYHPFLEEITLDNYTGTTDENGYHNLIALLTTKSKMTHLFYRDNNVRTGGDTRLSDFIATNPPLDLLGLCDNELEDNDAIMIAEALQHNTNLRRIDIGSNHFTELGVAALERAVCDQSSLNALSDCNHVCNINAVESSLVNWECPWKSNRRKKLYCLLSARNRKGINVDCLKKEMEDDDIFKLMPNILECIHRYHSCEVFERRDRKQEVFPLSIMFEMSRKMPEVYER